MPFRRQGCGVVGCNSCHSRTFVTILRGYGLDTVFEAESLSRILNLDGGGIKGTFRASALAALEEATQRQPVSERKIQRGDASGRRHARRERGPTCAAPTLWRTWRQNLTHRRQVSEMKRSTGGEEATHLGPDDITDEIATQDVESSEVLPTLQGLPGN